MNSSPHTISPQADILSHDPRGLVTELLAVGIALSATDNLTDLLTLILTKSREITCSDAGSVFLVDRQAHPPNLWFKTAQNDTHPELSLHEFFIPLNAESLVGYVALTGEILNIADAYEISPAETYQFNRSFDDNLSYRTRSVLVIPMQNTEGEIIGVLQLLNRKIRADIKITPDNASDVTVAYSHWEEAILRSLASQAAVSIERNHLLESIEKLFEGFVTASVQAIEARDKITAGHSERVADLTLSLAQEVNQQAGVGGFGGAWFDQRQLQELRYAALLHDFGKVGVPEVILSKEKKLYPLQLEIIRQRFHFVRRTLELECNQAKLDYLQANPHHDPDAGTCDHCQQLRQFDHQLQAQLQELDRYWQVIEIANEPKVLAEEPLGILQELTSWQYKDINGRLQPLVTMAELEQLLVRRGNLTPQERLAIESHVTHTYEFLRRIPWTSDLKNVPIIAYGHHERLNGQGYPLGIADIPLQTQMLTVADIYDALTAADRPYKKSLPVGVALKILHQEAESNQLNRDLVLLFEQKQVYQVLGHHQAD
ncbi:HD domain-containing phosphohydrolase [Thermosynechococcaceae cyanobacterium BACA0444]|uniref:HD domain-containing phosphohydrolase n=1 Tax=Pseudocalidococcus azoricus BACA0444 TaxID=2918990 RepID=A0AAE4FUD2_9CYAN|nr:HD domain-containing phosphohydrolase [Pseudocalidococcus azoricus]MDS3862043.1 HD domain-containing phosphohydrolase [Pseudocalidococcus azoricus BACA0444]